MRLSALFLTLFAAVITASVGAQPLAATAPRWPVLEAYAGKVILLEVLVHWRQETSDLFPALISKSSWNECPVPKLLE